MSCREKENWRLHAASGTWCHVTPPLRFLVVAVLLLTTTRVSAQTNSDGTGRLFAKEVLADNARKVWQQTSTLPPQIQFEALRKWVLPNPSNAGFRFDGWFDEHIDQQTSLNLKSPVLELIKLAGSLNRLSELRESAAESELNNTYDERCQAAFLAMVEIVDGNVAAAMPHTDVLDRIIREERPPPDAWPEYTLATLAVKTPELREFAIDALHSLNDWKRNRFNNRLYSLRNRIDFEFNRAKPPGLEWNTFGKPPKNWFQTTAIGAEELGTNLPGSSISFENDHLQTWSSCGSDVVFYQSPLNGDYNVECEIQTGSKSALSVGGYSFGFVSRGDALREGNSWRAGSSRNLSPPFFKVREQYVARAEVSGGTLTAYLNGRAVNTRQLDAGDAPWAAIQNSPGRHGVVRNIRISGNPVIPDQISMIGPRSFEGAWSKHLHYGVNWYVKQSTTSSSLKSKRVGTPGKTQPAELRCDKWTDMVGIGVESLLYYQRPMVEDGTIEFEFFHSSDTQVHPALGKTAFVLLPGGVRIHEVTNGIYETRRLPGLDLLPAAPSSQLTRTLPLKSDEWNRIKFELHQDTLTLSLNSMQIYRHIVRQSNSQRHFGLFHIADATGSRLRNMRWKGDWPKSVPSIEQQPFAESPHEITLAGKDFDTILDQNFATNPNLSAFELINGKTGIRVESTPQGIQVRIGSRKWNGSRMILQQPITGDFDAIVQYSRFKGAAADGQFSFALTAVDSSEFEAGISRYCNDNLHTVGGRMAIVDADGKKQYLKRNESCESKSGRLRLIRSGAKVFAFHAQKDSDQFHLVSTLALPNKFSAVRLRLTTSAMKGCSGSVCINNMTVLANTSP